MSRTLLRSLLSFAGVTLPLTWLWLGNQDACVQFFIGLARPLLIAVGAVQFPPSAIRDAMLLYVPFLGLLIATPGLSGRRRVIGGVLGVLGIFVSHVGLAWWASICFGGGVRGQEANARFLPGLLLAQGMPLFFWLAAALPWIEGLFEAHGEPEGDSAAPVGSRAVDD